MKHLLFKSLALFAMSLSLLLTTACEDDDDKPSALAIKPSSVQVNATNANDVVFHASGGKPPYKWKLSNAFLGTLTAAGDTAIYKSQALGGQNLITVTDDKSVGVTATVTQF